jgi:hypothetical protein
MSVTSGQFNNIKKMTEFSTLFKSYSAEQLLQILEKKNEYQTEAVNAAQSELDSRKLNTEALLDAQSALNEITTGEFRKTEKLRTVTDKLKTITSEVFDLDPSVTKTPEKNIKIMCIVLTAMLLYKILSNADYILALVKDMFIIDSGLLLYLLTFIYVPAGIYFTWRKKKAGWIMLFAWGLLTIFSIILELYLELKILLRPVDEETGDLSLLIDTIYPRKNIFYTLIALLFYTALNYYLMRPEIRKLFDVDKRSRTVTIVLALLLLISTFLLLSH